MSNEKDDIKFKELLADKRHKELATTLKGILKNLDESKPGNNSEIVDAIGSQSEAIKGFAEAIKNIPEPKVNVEVNNDKVEASIKKLGTDILKSLEEVRDLLIVYNQPKEYIFTVKRGNYNQLIETVIVKESIAKPKYQA